MRGAPRTGRGVAVAGLAVALLIPTAAVAQTACKPAASPASEKALTAMIAADRKAAKVGKVAKDPVLMKAGRQKSLQMARGGKFAHSGSMAWAQGRSGAQNIAMAPTPVIFHSPDRRFARWAGLASIACIASSGDGAIAMF